tara:strand:- start:4098 stop:4841 length:744 start_codon:yes stop_codon:yes gene_type:complete
MKNKDVVFIIAVKKDGQLKPEYEIGIESWRRWCKKNDVELFLLEEPVLPMEDMHIIWQRYFLFDIYDANEIKANQTLMVDADTIIHPDCPNFFNETENKYCMIHDDGSYDWILRGMEHYSKYVYDGAWFNYWEYGNSGFQIVNDSHRDFFQYMRDFYFENIDNINMIQQKWGVGTDQTPLNFNLNLQKVDVKLLPYKYNMGCMIKKEILDQDMLFTKIGWIYHFNGIPNKDEQVPLWMKKTFDYLYG